MCELFVWAKDFIPAMQGTNIKCSKFYWHHSVVIEDAYVYNDMLEIC